MVGQLVLYEALWLKRSAAYQLFRQRDHQRVFGEPLRIAFFFLSPGLQGLMTGF